MSMYMSSEQREKQQQQQQTRCRDVSGNSSCRSRMKPQPLLGGPRSSSSDQHGPVTAFLREIGLVQYATVLRENGFDDMETLCGIEDVHMRELGMPAGHIVKLKKRLQEYGGNGRQAMEALPMSGGTSAMISSPPRTLKGVSDCQPDCSSMTAVQASWQQVKRMGTNVAGGLFYRKFFKIEPEAKKLFPISVRLRYKDWDCEEEEDDEDPTYSPALRKLWANFITAVGSAVAGIRDPAKMVPRLQMLGARHVGYGLKQHYFHLAGKVLVEVLSEWLGNSFTREVENAWAMVASFMVATMLAGYEQARADVKATEQQIAAQFSKGRDSVCTPDSSTAASALGDIDFGSRQVSTEQDDVVDGSLEGSSPHHLPTLLRDQLYVHGRLDEKPLGAPDFP